MDAAFHRAVTDFIVTCRYVTSVHDLVTKWRVYLVDGYYMDLYFNRTLGKYGYTLVRQNQRILGWDNALHHPELANFPHHFHTIHGQVEPSTLVGEPQQDLLQVRLSVEDYLSATTSP